MSERPKEEFCGPCKYWIQQGCRKHAPIRMTEEGFPRWPHTNWSDWCGDFEEREENGKR